MNLAAYVNCSFRYDDGVPPWNGFSVIAAVVCLILPLALAFGGGTTFEILRRLPLSARLLLPCWSAIPYLLVSIPYQVFRIHWLIIYALLPTLITVALWRARERDPRTTRKLARFCSAAHPWASCGVWPI